jgi:L-seryl-tRNA(Ser) seleniumtransferase
MVVNNNAAAVLLVLTALCCGKEVVVSRGELVEIGGSFRVPEVMEQGGAVLKEVGTTNKTRLPDYAAAVTPGLTGALLKVHPSNFRVLGFTEEAALWELAALGRELCLPVIYDLGSGARCHPAWFGADEPTVTGAVRDGADILMFSGDKLLGGPQSGIIIGRRAYMDKIKAHPLSRALRVDKLTLAALEATLHLYRDEEQARSGIPTLAALTEPLTSLEKRARRLLEMLQGGGYTAALEQMEGQVGGGSLPGWSIQSFGVSILPNTISIQELDARMRRNAVPIVGRISKDRYLLDVRTVTDHEFEEIAAALTAAVAGDRE